MATGWRALRRVPASARSPVRPLGPPRAGRRTEPTPPPGWIARRRRGGVNAHPRHRNSARGFIVPGPAPVGRDRRGWSAHQRPGAPPRRRAGSPPRRLAGRPGVYESRPASCAAPDARGRGAHRRLRARVRGALIVLTPSPRAEGARPTRVPRQDFHALTPSAEVQADGSGKPFLKVHGLAERDGLYLRRSKALSCGFLEEVDAEHVVRIENRTAQRHLFVVVVDHRLIEPQLAIQAMPLTPASCSRPIDRAGGAGGRSECRRRAG